MKQAALDVYRCPRTGAKLRLEAGEPESADIEVGVLSGGITPYRIVDGMPTFAATEALAGTASFARQYYASIASTYDENVQVTFDLYHEDEQNVRASMIDLLHLRPSSKVLEISAGTGKDSELIAQKLSAEGELWLLDISPDMLRIAKEKISARPIRTEAAVGDACWLPYPDNYFDALYCFAGVGHFTERSRALQEMSRVVRVGGRVVFAEKNVPPWLRNTEYGRILINNNPMFADANPLEILPTTVRNAGIRWILGNVHYVVDYTVGEGEPMGNFDLELPGARGGTFNTRYFGKLEGVTPEAKELCVRAAASCGMSVHDWLDSIVKERAKLDLR